ncbi:uncharacterized protein BO95DRAFT_269726 [Aspergillus brunneoviolaceus CBS 621.78]|uniref:Uncharacterized protein n=1 Tax=Aspergillus brunneoviolaceus CBS 621.78 TaxID=1450534 RepID=A0ACD1GKA5_9EURO|nr:hypothetical protein BO95DRAFT_269726 [Aspergillus brunneoviolaceus CBS 621.78]RAH49652.1 hypothetical protein BO95DRAFT_269726 [Aspergillus brunneoviolaceus CBS 621.78]
MHRITDAVVNRCGKSHQYHSLDQTQRYQGLYSAPGRYVSSSLMCRPLYERVNPRSSSIMHLVKGTGAKVSNLTRRTLYLKRRRFAGTTQSSVHITQKSLEASTTSQRWNSPRWRSSRWYHCSCERSVNLCILPNCSPAGRMTRIIKNPVSGV